ncbi:MAG TPA: glycosyltransferase family 2 protein [Candidatus Latescibacteria bacterium]|nr:glycosyltransferase family 2 protein [Candidatus Latescibacterota bacterium]
MISVVIPCYNEEEVLPQLFARLGAAAETWGEEYEVLLVDDGSRDTTWQLILEQHARDERWRGISFARNFGHQTAISAGIHYARGCAVILMDADLQDPPEQLHRFIAAWRDGNDVVYAIRATRKENILKRAAYKAFYRVLRSLASIEIPLDSGDFCLMDRKVVDVLKAMPERNRFVRGLRSWAGFRQTGLEYDRDARAAGEVKYTFRKLVKLALDGVVSFSTTPLRMATYLGFGVSIVALFGAAFTILQRIFVDWFTRIGFPYVPGFYTLFTGILFLGGVQLICLGIIGEYLGRIFDEVKGRPLWTIRETAGLGMDAQK